MANNLRLYALIFLVSILVACGQAETNETVALATVTAVPVSPTSISLSPTPTPTTTTIPTQTPTPSATATATAIPTLTPLPTFAPDELETAVADLLANPMNCDVPCWWGSIPGTTTIDEVKHTIAPYNFDINEYYDEEGGVYLRLGIGYIEERNGFEVRIVYGFFDSILTDVTAYSPSISEILAIYGQPDQVWISAENDPRQQPPLVRISIAYLQKGIGLGYFVYGDIQDDMLIGCFADEKTGHLHLVTPDSAISYKDFSTIFSKEMLYLPLNESSNLTIDDFSKLSNDPNQPQCLETPIELWE